MAGFAVLARRTENSPLDCFVDGRPIDFPSHKSCITHPRSKKNLNQTHTAFNLSLFLAGVAGFEPTNAGIKIPCLTAWRHPNIKNGAGDKFRTCYLQSHNLALYRLSYARHIIGAPGETRTPDTRLRRPLLYPAELRARKHFFCCALKP